MGACAADAARIYEELGLRVRADAPFRLNERAVRRRAEEPLNAGVDVDEHGRCLDADRV